MRDAMRRLCALLMTALLVLDMGLAYGQEDLAISNEEAVLVEELPAGEEPAEEEPAEEELTAEEEPAEEEPAEEVLVDEEPSANEADAVEVRDDDVSEEQDDDVSDSETEAAEAAALGAQAVSQEQPSVRYRAHVQRDGWQAWFSDGEVAGTSGESLRMEAFRIELRNAKGKLVRGISYQTHVQSIGWQDWVSDGTLAGTEGRSLRAEAIRIKLSDELAESYDVWYCVHIQRHGWLGWAKNGAAAGSSGNSLRVEALRVCLVPKGDPAPSASSEESFVDGARIELEGHVQRIGWVSGTTSVGTVGQSLRMEAIKARLVGAQYEGGVCYSAHVQGIGWQQEVSNGRVAGTSGQSKRVEAITMRLTGSAAEHYDVWYRLHVQTFGWLGWAQNGERAGTEGLSRRAESIEVRLLPKGSAQPSSTDSDQSAPYIGAVSLAVRARLLGGSWSGVRAAGQTVGSTKQDKALELLRASVSVPEGALDGGISYRVRPVGGGWQSASQNGADAGVAGTGLNGIRMNLTGGIKNAFDVWYRTYVTKYGWLGWVRGGSQAGTEVSGAAIEALQITVLPKGQTPGGSSSWSAGYMTQALADSHGQPLSEANTYQMRIVQSARTTPSAPAGYCAMWVENVYANAGYGSFMGDACDLYDRYCFSSDLSQLKCGMIVAVSTHPHTSAGSIWGHVGIYVGDGKVMDSVYGYVRTNTLEDWMDFYGVTVPVKWGWLGNVHVV